MHALTHYPVEDRISNKVSLIFPIFAANCVTEEGKTVCKTLRVYLAKCLGRTLARRVTQDKLEGLVRSIMQIVDKIAQLSKQFNKDAENIALNKLPGTSPIMVEIFNKDPHIDAK